MNGGMVIEQVLWLDGTWSPMSLQAGSRLQAAWLQPPPSFLQPPDAIPLHSAAATGREREANKVRKILN